jgi:hypothetical protein
MLRHLLLLFVLANCVPAVAQQYKVYGKITNSKLEPLALVSIQLKNGKLGTLSQTDGTYALELEGGKYEVIFTIIGYASQTIELVVQRNTELNLILTEDSKNLSEVLVKSRAKDRAEEIVRQVIRHKEQLIAAAGNYTCKVYIKAVQHDSSATKSNRKNKSKDTTSLSAETAALNRMAMAEVLLHMDYGGEQHIKEERMGVKKWGNTAGLFYLSATEGVFNFYNNLVKVPALSATPFLSPVSYSGLVAYRYKTLRIQQKGSHKIYTISVKPTRLSNATVEGEMDISDSSWALLHTRFRLPSYHVPEYDFFEVEQHYMPVGDKTFMLGRQQFTYFAKGGKQKLSGKTTVHYTDYELNREFGKKHFGNEVSATALEAYSKDSTFWHQVRTEPLTTTELRFIQYKDSVYRATHTKQYLDSIDKKTNQVTWKKVLFSGQNLFKREKERNWNLPPLVGLVQPFSFGGVRILPSVAYSKIAPSRKNLYAYANISYGIKNRDVNGNIRITRMYNPFNRGYYRIAAGRDFHFIFSGDAWINMLKRNNIYLNNYLSAAHGLELVNGLFLHADAEMALRRSVSNYKTNSLVDSTLGDILENNRATAFTPYNALYGTLRLQYTPGQRYIREPREKVILGSAWPTFYTSWRKGIPNILSSRVDFDYLEFGMEQEIKAGLVGNSRYKVKSGTFLNKNNLQLVDYQFQRRGDPLLFLNPDEAFQALDSTFPVFKRTYQAHYVHDFNGFFINRIPLLKKLGLREVAGGGFLFAPERDLRYVEAFTGIERVFKWPFNAGSKFKLGVYVVGSAANKFQAPVQFKVGVTSWDPLRNRWF